MPLLKVEDLTKTFKGRKRLFGTSYFNAVENISFSLERQQTISELLGKMARENPHWIKYRGYNSSLFRSYYI